MKPPKNSEKKPVSRQPTGTEKELILDELAHLIQLHHHSPRLPNHQENSMTIEQILPVIFHKLKNHLTPILGYSQILQNKMTDPEHLARINKIHDNAELLLDRFDTLMDTFSVKKMPMGNTDINRVIEDLESDFRSRARVEGVRVKYDLHKELPSLQLNIPQIQLLFRELFENALRSIRCGEKDRGTICIRSRREGSEVRISFEDDGAGILPEHVDHVFEVFFTTFSDRAGLGLSLCENLVKAHEGRIQVSSEPGAGTRFELRFPLNPTGSGITSPSAGPGRPRILLVGPGRSAMHLLEDLLRHMNNQAQLFRAADDREAIELLDTLQPDLIVTWIPYAGFDDFRLAGHLIRQDQAEKLMVVENEGTGSDFEKALRKYQIAFAPGSHRISDIISMINAKIR